MAKTVSDTVRSAKTFHDELGAWKRRHPLVNAAFMMGCRIDEDPFDAGPSAFEKIIDMPVDLFTLPEVTVDPALQRVQSTSGIKVDPARKTGLPQPPDLNLFFLFESNN